MQPAWTGTSLRCRQAPGAAGVALGAGQRDVAGDRGEGQDLDLVGRGQGQEDRDGVVLAGVAVEDDAVRRHLSLR